MINLHAIGPSLTENQTIIIWMYQKASYEVRMGVINLQYRNLKSNYSSDLEWRDILDEHVYSDWRHEWETAGKPSVSI